MNGYTVALFQAQASAAPLALLDDGFESGSFSKWTGTSISYGEKTYVSASGPYSGTYSAAFTTDGGSNYEYAYYYKSVSVSEVYV